MCVSRWGVQMVGDIIRSGWLFTADCARGGQKKPVGSKECREERGFGVKTAKMASKGEAHQHNSGTGLELV